MVAGLECGQAVVVVDPAPDLIEGLLGEDVGELDVLGRIRPQHLEQFHGLRPVLGRFLVPAVLAEEDGQVAEGLDEVQAVGRRGREVLEVEQPLLKFDRLGVGVAGAGSRR